MRAIVNGEKLELRRDWPVPAMQPGEARIRTRLAGICNTDIEIVRGYFGFHGVLGHEFVGEVLEAPSRPDLVGRRVVGEINAYCGECATCRRVDPTHCPHRTTLGIYNRDGAMADEFLLPAKLLHPLADNLADEEAVFVEPLAAACEILEQIQIKPTDRVAVLGDGKLGLLIAQVLQLTGCRLTAVGRHERKLDFLKRRGIATSMVGTPPEPGFDIVVEATGSAAGFAEARRLVRPRGTLVLKSTFHGEVAVNLSMLVVDEIRLVGSRCGPFDAALRLLERRLVEVRPLIDSVYTLEEGLAAFERAASPGALKVLVRP